MDNPENQNEPQITPIQSTPKPPEPVVVQVDPPKPKKKRSTLAITTAFMAGALTYALAAGAYNFYFQNQENELLRAQADAKSQTVQSQSPLGAVPEEQTKISENEVAESVETANCITKPEYSELVLRGSKMKIVTIDLYDGLQVSSATLSGAARWSVTPKVTNFKCEVIKITELEVGDRVNVYVSKTSSGMLDTKMLQKATK